MEYGAAAVLDFLAHAGERGMLPAATASALAVACRTVFEILDAEDAEDLRRVDLDRLVKQFSNKRARDFNPSSLKEYGRRVKRAWDLFSDWKSDPANFAPKTRTTAPAKRAKRLGRSELTEAVPTAPLSKVLEAAHPKVTSMPDSFSTAFPIRRGHIVTLNNIPDDLTAEEAERLASYIKLLGVEP